MPTSPPSKPSTASAIGIRNKPRAARAAKRRPWAVSPLTLRILGVNVIALAILGGGILYLAQFETNLIDQRLDTLKVEAEIIAGALGESATGGPESSRISQAPAANIITRLVGPTKNRARLFDASGRMMVDSRLTGPDGGVRIQPLPPLESRPGLTDRLNAAFDAFLIRIGSKRAYPPLEERPDMRLSDFSEASIALTGGTATQIRRRDDNSLVLSVAVPVQRFRQVLGVLLLSSGTEQIDAIVREERRLILSVFAVSLTVTLLLTLFLAGTIAQPIRRLALAAEKVGNAIGRDQHFPEFPDRRDEIGDLSRSLAAMTRALYDQINAVEAFAADVSHELKNPLSSLRSAVDSLKLTKDPAVQDKLLAILQDDVRRLDRLITDIADASRLDAELLRTRMEKVDLTLLLETLLEVYETIGQDRKVSVRGLTGEEGGFQVGGIESRLSQVICNLIDNAISFSPEGGTVTARLAQADWAVRLVVEDEGPGLPEGSEDRIFERFYSERPEQEAFGTHSGLGLSICRQIVEAHGGRIEADNRLDASGQVLGARFTVTLPAYGGPRALPRG